MVWWIASRREELPLAVHVVTRSPYIGKVMMWSEELLLFKPNDMSDPGALLWDSIISR